MQFADPAWQPKVTQEFEKAQLASQSAGSPAPDATAHVNASQPAGEAKYDDYVRGYRAESTQSAGRDDSFREPPSSQSQQTPPLHQMQQPWYRRLPVWAWWLIGALVLSSIVEPASSGRGAFGSVFGLLFILFLLFVGWLLFTRRVRVNLYGETQPPETRTFNVGARPTIVIRNKAGAINLRAGQEGQVSIATTRRGYLFSQRFDKEAQVWYNQDTAANTISARTDSWRLFGKNSINFDIVVPPRANLELVTNAGNVSVQNIAGQMTLRSDAGSIRATQVTLQGKSRLKTDAGTITFTGSLDPTGNYEFTTDLGTIDATLPADASFDLNASTDVGTVSTNLPLIQQQRSKARGQVGSGPYPKLKLKTDMGTVRVQRG